MEMESSGERLASAILRRIRSRSEQLAGAGEPEALEEIAVESPAFGDGQEIPASFVGKVGRSPALRWNDVPAGTEELVLICEDPDAPMPRPFVHWIVYGIPASESELAEGLPPSPLPLLSGARQGQNSLSESGYLGPMPPRGHGVHHYHFQLFALDHALDVEAPVDRDQLVKQMAGHVLGMGEIVGTFENE